MGKNSPLRGIDLHLPERAHPLRARPDGTLVISPLVRFGRESSSDPVTPPDVEPWAGEGPEPDPAVSHPRSLRPLIALVVVVWAVIVGLAVWA